MFSNFKSHMASLIAEHLNARHLCTSVVHARSMCPPRSTMYGQMGLGGLLQLGIGGGR